MYYNYDSSDDEWPEARYRRLAEKKKSFPTNQDIFDRAESKLGVKYNNDINAKKGTSAFTDFRDRPYIARNGDRSLHGGQSYKWANQSADMFNTNMATDIDARVTRFVSNKTPFTYAASRMQEYGGNDRPNYISPPSNKYCKGNIMTGRSCIQKKETFVSGMDDITMEGMNSCEYCKKHDTGDIGIILDAVSSPLFLLIILLVILAYVVELLRNVREMIVAIHHTNSRDSNLK